MQGLYKKVIFYGQRTIKSYKIREIIREFQAKRIGKDNFVSESNLIDENNESQFQESLNKNGFVELDKKLSQGKINSILNFSENLDLFDPFNPKFGTFKKDEIPQPTHVSNFKREDLVRCDTIMDIANDPGILRVVQEFLGCKPTISNINMWWSIAGKDKAKDAQLFHRDVDDIRFCKLFIYLTDVGENDGPHTYVKGSSSTNKLTKIRRYEDTEIIEAFDEKRVIKFIRPKGSCFLVDTYGFHKGTLPRENDRLLLQIQYSINPIGIESYSPIYSTQNYNVYTNRLIIKS